MEIYKSILHNKKSGRRMLALLVDPDKPPQDGLIGSAASLGADMIFVGGSIISVGDFAETISEIRKQTTLPVMIFPGNHMQVSSKADAILLLSLISGRNADMLIGQHVIAAPALRQSGLEIISCGYMLIGNDTPTAAQYISNTQPVPHDKPEIAMCTAMAGEMLGLKILYLDGGSGAINPVSPAMIRKVVSSVEIPVIVGGGITSPEKAYEACNAGADIIVIGTAVERNAELLQPIGSVVHSFKQAVL